MHKNTHRSKFAWKVVFGIATIVLVSALVLLGALSTLDLEWRSPAVVMLVSLLLAVVAGPSVYWLVYAPLPSRPAASEDVSLLAITDALTHTMNRRGITMGVLEAMAQAERYNTLLSVAIVDVDRFQRVNDDLGKTAGDKVLAELADALANTLRMPDKVGRYDGEEFLVVLPHTGLMPARKIAERMRSNVGNAKLGANGKRVPLTVSVGVTQYTKGKDLEHLLSRAYAALADAKRDGGNRVVARKPGR